MWKLFIVLEMCADADVWNQYMRGTTSTCTKKARSHQQSSRAGKTQQEAEVSELQREQHINMCKLNSLLR
jgi:hypothetical protein